MQGGTPMCDHSLPRRRYYFHLKDPGSAITHFFGLVGAVLAMPALLIHGAWEGYSPLQMAALSVFLLSMVGLYAASTAYHSFDLEHGRNRILKKRNLQPATFIVYRFGVWGKTPRCFVQNALMSGAISRSGIMTKSRCHISGWGMVSSGVSMWRSSYSRMSMSITLSE